MDGGIAASGPILVFGGPYSNLEATQAVLAEARRRRIPPQRVICTGDVVAYGADAAATVAALRLAGVRVIMGNCEESLAAGAQDCGCGYAAGSACDRLAAAWYGHALRALENEARQWMARLPRRLDLMVGGRHLAVIHGGVRQINRFVFASTPGAVKREELAAVRADGVLAGHSGIPFSEIVDGALWHNAGAIGMPANDGTPRGWFSLLIPREDGIMIEHHAFDYAHGAAAAKMRAAGLPEGYAQALETGRWPSSDILPADELRQQGRPLAPGTLLWMNSRAPEIRCWPTPAAASPPRPLEPQKFRDPEVTADGERRAGVAFRALRTLWFNTGTLCNIACEHCYIDSSPRNDRLSYLTLAEVRAYLDEIRRNRLPTEEIGFTGGEPFMNPDLLPMLEECLSRGFRVLVLTNAMRPMQRLKAPLLDVQRRLGRRLAIRVSLDHYARALHEEERGASTWQPTIEGLRWLASNGFRVSVAGRMLWGESEVAMRQGYAQLFADLGIAIDAGDREQLFLFPEMDRGADISEIEAGWWAEGLRLGLEEPMCASSRMVVKRKGAAAPSVVACTLLPYDEAFELGGSLAQSAATVPLNHPHCAQFCILGGASCSLSSSARELAEAKIGGAAVVVAR